MAIIRARQALLTYSGTLGKKFIIMAAFGGFVTPLLYIVITTRELFFVKYEICRTQTQGPTIDKAQNEQMVAHMKTATVGRTSVLHDCIPIHMPSVI